LVDETLFDSQVPVVNSFLIGIEPATRFS